MMLLRVDFPAPFSPSSAWIAPSRTNKSAPPSAWMRPKLFSMPVQRSAIRETSLKCMLDAEHSRSYLIADIQHVSKEQIVSQRHRENAGVVLMRDAHNCEQQSRRGHG